MSHRWSGWPGAWCLDCGIEDPSEICIASNAECVCYPGQTEPCKVVMPSCPSPGEGRFDPYRKGVRDKDMRETQEATGTYVDGSTKTFKMQRHECGWLAVGTPDHVRHADRVVLADGTVIKDRQG